jgi:amino acid transporter
MSATESKEGLRQVIGVAGLTLAIVNGVIGAGIFALPGRVGVALGAYGVIGYVVCAIMLAAIMLCYAEIGSRVTTSGGSYAYVEHTFGPFAGYVANWLYFFGWSILSSAALINIIADSLARIVPVLEHPVARIVFFALLTGFMVTLNVRGVRQGIGFIKGVTIVKLIPLLALIVFGIGLIDADNLKWGDLPPLRAFGDATLILFFAFAGFETVLGASGEIRNPRRTVPLGIAFGGLIVMIVYMLLQMVTQGVLGSGIAGAVDAPLAAVADRIIGPVGATVLLIAAAVSCFGGVFADILATPRALFAMSNDGMFPAFLGRVHPRFATPYLAIVAYGAAIFVFASIGGFEQLAILASAAILLIYLAVVLSMIKLRLDRPDTMGAFFRAPGGWLTPGIAIATILWLLSRLTWQEWAGTMVFIAIVCGLYGLTRYQVRAR